MYILVVFVIIIVFATYKRLKSTKQNDELNSGSFFNGQEDFPPIAVFSEPMVDSLIRKGYENYICNDYVCGVKNIVLNFNNSIEMTNTLKPVLNDILNYLKLPNVVSLKVIMSNEKNNKLESSGKAGEYHGEWANRKITLNINKDYSFDNILAILCHECTHFFMQYNNLNWNDTELNERRTDIIACLIGFSKVLSSGYEEREIINYKLGYNEIRHVKIGYISDKECKDLVDYLTYKRSIINHKKEVELQTKELKDKICELTELSKNFDNILNEINPTYHKELYDIKRYDDISCFQKSIIDLNSLNVKEVLIKCQNSIQKDLDKESLTTLLKDIENMCSKQQKLIQTFQKYQK